jgi:hypothetical protein
VAIRSVVPQCYFVHTTCPFIVCRVGQLGAWLGKMQCDAMLNLAPKRRVSKPNEATVVVVRLAVGRGIAKERLLRETIAEDHASR